jgi:hypothetical protein
MIAMAQDVEPCVRLLGAAGPAAAAGVLKL